ncbi:MAG: carboxypeptidase-like regulatory domain-containing protein, partial [Candidatus Caldarchaeum sp.]
GQTGVAEIEFWPGPPGTGTFRFLLSGYNIDFFIFNDYTGGALIRDGFPAGFTGVFLSFLVASRNALELTPLAPHKAPDIAVARSGHVFITANVHDLAYRLVDNLGNPAPAANTAITLQRGNGPPITKRGADTIPDFFPSTGGLQWSYDQHGEGWAVFYQLPEDLAYMVTVTFDGTPVGEATVDKLTHTIMEDLVLRIYKVKLTFVDCVDSPLSREAFVKVIPPSPATPYVTQLDSTGALDFGYLAGGEYTIDGVWWKGVWVKFTEARIGDRSLSLNPDGSLTFTVDSNIDSPIKLTALINDFIFTTWDFNQDNKIPRLNITLTWVGVHPLTGSRLYFLETMDPTGDTNPVKFNTTKSVSQFLSYRIDHFYGGKSTSRGLKTYADVRYVFYKMPSTFYNITVTTVTTGDPETEQTPGNSKWPGRTVPVDYEIKIDWTGHSSPPSIRKTPAGTVNDRVVLRVYMTMGGQFVTDPSLNPIGNATLYTTCGPVRIDLLTWAHTFYQRIVDGDFDYLNEARRIGNATYHIVNDNGVQMEMYIPEDGVFSTLFVSKWTEDTLLTTWLKADSQHSSNIWWNGSYRKQDLTFYSYVYPLEFTRGEQPWARFYDRVGLTGTGTLTTEDGPMDHDNDPEVTPNSFLINRFFNTSAPRRDNATWPRHNFTVVGNEGLWNQQRWRWEQAVADGLVPEVPTRPYSLVFEKEVVTVPIPVGFITLSLKDEDLARPIPYAVVELSIYTRTSNTDPSGVRYFSAVYKTGRDGNLTLLYPTQEMVENIVSPNAVKNFTLTVFWYLNSSIVYKDAFNLTKRGYSVDKVAIADVTFVLAISANKDRPVKDLYARIWWLNVTDGTTVFPGRITVDHARKTWTYTAVPETRGAAKWTTGQLTLPWLPTSERFTKSDWDLVFDSDLGRWVYDDVTRTWDIPYPSDRNGAPIAGWPYNPQPTGYYRALTFDEDAAIQYRISVWSDQLPIDPSSQDYNNGAWQRDHYELVWRIPAEFPFAWMLFGHPPFDITFYRGSTGVGGFTPIPGYALTRTWTATPSPGSKVVAIKLNATDVEIPVFWQVGDYELGSYDCGPLLGYIVKGRIVPPAGATFGPRTIDAVTTAGTITVGDKTVDVCIAGKPVGLVTVTSGDTPSTVIWGGSSLVIDEVSPPPSIWYNDGTGQAGADNPNRGTTSNYWRNWVSQAIDPITGQPVNLHVGDQLQVPGVDLGIQYMGYGRPYEGVSRVATVEVFSNDPDNRAHRPFIKMFEFQNVSARITDFNGRPLPGAFYQLIDSQTGKSAAWSYAGPDGRIVPMPIRKPGGVFIQRVLYLGQGANGEPTWPVNSFARWPIAYDSRDDETTQETQKPDIPLGFAYTAEAGPWPTGDGWVQADVCRHAGDGSYNYTTSVLEALASCPPAGWGRSFDVITRIFDLRVRFVYGDAQRPADPAYVFSAPSLALSDDFIIRGQGAIFEAKRLARSSYDIVALWPDANGEEVGRRTFDISTTNVGTVEGTVVLALRDVSFNVVDRQGRPLSGARVSVSPDLVRDEDIQLRPDSIFTILRIPDGRTYDFTVEWTSPFGTTARAAVRDTPAGLQSRGSITLPVDDVTLTVVDFDGRPVAGAAIRFAGQDVGTTDSQGIIIIGQVPLDNEYQIEVAKDGTTIGGDRVRFTASRTSATIQAGVYDITVLVKGAAGQPIQGAIVELQRGGTTVATAATDASGSAVFSKVVGADYSVKASYEQFSSSANVARGTRSATLVLDLYTVILGVPMTLATFLALIIGLILLVIVIVVIVSEYIRWRGRRLGIYPAAPPKK